MSYDDHRPAALCRRWPALRLNVRELLCLTSIVAIDVVLGARFRPQLSTPIKAGGHNGYDFILAFTGMSHGIYVVLLLWGWFLHRNLLSIPLVGERRWMFWLVVHVAVLAAAYVLTRDQGAGLTFVVLLFDALFLFFIFGL